jgi:hypothetical protein
MAGEAMDEQRRAMVRATVAALRHSITLVRRAQTHAQALRNYDLAAELEEQIIVHDDRLAMLEMRLRDGMAR